MRHRVNEMVITKTRAFQLHAGDDLYPAVTTYLGAVVAERIKVVNEMARAHSILLQVEAEAKDYSRVPASRSGLPACGGDFWG